MSIVSTVTGVGLDFKRFFWPPSHGQKLIRIGAIVLVAAVASRFLFTNSVTETPPTTANSVPSVELISAAMVAEDTAYSFIGTVRAVSEAQIQSEVGGRVTSVRVSPGDTVAAGTIVATLENAAQSAAVLQAEGAYESALAAAAQSETGIEGAQASLEQAENTAVAAVRSAAGTFDSTVINTIDTYFSSPDSQVPGVRIDSRYTSQLNNARLELARILPELRQSSDVLTTSNNLPAAISETRAVGERIVQILDWLIEDVRTASARETLDGQPVTSYSSSLTSARSAVVGSQASLNSAATGLTQARTALAQAEQAVQSSADTVSAADAQIKSALGSLRAAQAQLAKTILRTPIAGTVNEVLVNTGDFVSPQTKVAEVANNGSLEVQFYVTEQDAANLETGQTVMVGGTATGTIVSIAPAVSQNTAKTEVRAAVEATANLVNGSSVRVSPQTRVQADDTSSRLVRLPLSAVRFTASEGFVFVVTDGALTAVPVTLGDISGSTIVIREGIGYDTLVVADARGLSENAEVTISP